VIKVKIAQVTAISDTVEAFLLPLIEKLAQRGHDIEIITHDPDGRLSKNEIIKKYDCSVFNVDIPRSISPWKMMSSYNTIYELFKGMKPDVVQTHTPVASLLARKAAAKAKVPRVIYTCHGFYFHENMNHFMRAIYAHLEKKAAVKYTDYIFTVNEEDKKFAIAHHFIDEDHIINIQSVGIDTKVRFNPIRVNDSVKAELRTELRLSDKESVITYVGRLVREKGVFELIEAFSILAEVRKDVKLLIVGETLKSDRDSDMNNTLKNMIKTKNLQDRVIFTGQRTDIPELLSITDMFVLPSYREGMPVSSLEALSMGVPVVGTFIRGLREEVIEGETGFLVPVKDSKRLYKAMEKTLNSIGAPSEKCRNFVIQNFDQEDVLKRQLRIYDKIEDDFRKPVFKG
jgi:glycosyltransferase involved in cell wall biosynthesis